MPKFIIKNKIIIFSVAIVIIIFTIFFLTYNDNNKETTIFINPTNKTSEIKSEKVAITTENKTLNALFATLEINEKKYKGEISKNTTVYDFMDNLRDKGDISFTDKTYMGMGKMITTISGTKSNGSYTWIYCVNGIKAEMGVSNYKINPDDVVSWKYEKVHY